MHICISKLTIIGSDNGLSPGRHQAIIWTNAGILLIGPLGTNFSETLIEILTFSFKKMRMKGSSAKRRPFCLSLNVLKVSCKRQPWCLLPELFSVESHSLCNPMIYYSLNSTIWIYNQRLIHIHLNYLSLMYGDNSVRYVRIYQLFSSLENHTKMVVKQLISLDHSVIKEKIILIITYTVSL